MVETTQIRREISDRRLWFGLVGGGIAWVLHLLLIWAIAEFACVGSKPHLLLLGVSWVSWLLLGVSVATIALGLAAAWVAHRSDRELGERPAEEGGRLGERTLVRLGLFTSLLFVFIMLVQCVPIFFFLRDC